MSLTRLFVERPTLVTVFLALVLLAGVLGGVSLIQQQFPNTATPSIQVLVSYPGASTTEMRDSIVVPIENQIAGTPDDCIQQVAELRRLTGMDHLVTEFSFGSMPHHLAERNMRLFGAEVLPVLQRDAAFQGEIEPAPLAIEDEKERLFAPA